MTVKEIADRANNNLPEVDRISPTTVWRFIGSQGFLSKLPIEKHILTETQKSIRKKFENKILTEIGQMLFLQMKQHSESARRREDVGKCQTFQITLQLESYQKR